MVADHGEKSNRIQGVLCGGGAAWNKKRVKHACMHTHRTTKQRGCSSAHREKSQQKTSKHLTQGIPSDPDRSVARLVEANNGVIQRAPVTIPCKTKTRTRDAAGAVCLRRPPRTPLRAWECLYPGQRPILIGGARQPSGMPWWGEGPRLFCAIGEAKIKLQIKSARQGPPMGERRLAAGLAREEGLFAGAATNVALSLS